MKTKVKLISGIVAGMGLYVLAQQKLLKRTKYKIIDLNIPENFNNFKIAQISDFHNTKGILAKEVIEVLKHEKPDIIVITGDIVAYNGYDASKKFINQIVDIANVYYVSGNHEAKSSKYHRFLNYITKKKVILLDDMFSQIKIKDQAIDIMGIEDPQMSFKYLSDGYSAIIDKKIKTLSEYRSNNYSILLIHRPTWFDIYKKYNINLVLTGHAHGGQWRVPFVGGVYSSDEGMWPKYTNGIVSENDTKMIINRGVGTQTMIPRLNNRPEIVIVELRNS